MESTPHEVVIRRATVRDAELLAELDARAGAGGWSKGSYRTELMNTVARLWVAERAPFEGPAEAKERACGFAVAWFIDEEVQLQNIAVDPRHRRQGIGRLLVNQVVELGRTQGARVVDLEVRRGNQAAISLYTSMGFEQVGMRRGYYGDGEDALLLRLQL